jgi:hypothetical protein
MRLPEVPIVRESYGDNIYPASFYMRLWKPALPRRLNVVQRWLRARRIAKRWFRP